MFGSALLASRAQLQGVPELHCESVQCFENARFEGPGACGLLTTGKACAKNVAFLQQAAVARQGPSQKSDLFLVMKVPLRNVGAGKGRWVSFRSGDGGRELSFQLQTTQTLF